MLPKLSFTKWLFVLSPLLLLFTLVIARQVAWRYFVMCKTGRCESLGNLASVFVPEKPELSQINPSPMPAKWAGSESDPETGRRAVRGARYSARFTWVFLALVCGIVCVAAFAIGAWVIFVSTQQFGGHVYWVGTLLLALVLWIGLWLRPDLTMPVIIDFLRGTIENTNNIGFAKGIASVIGGINSFAHAAAMFLGAAMASILLGIERKGSGVTLEAISEAMKRLQMTLYTGTVMLVVGVLLERALWQWVVTFTSREEHAAKAAHSFVGTITSVDGGVFTLALAAVYLPAAAILRKRAEQVRDLPKKVKEKDQALKDHGVHFSFLESVPRLAAILAPLLAGPIGELFTRLAK